MHLQKCRESRKQNTAEPNPQSPEKRKIQEEEYSSPKRRRVDEDQDEKRVPPFKMKIPRDQELENTGSSPSQQDNVTIDKVAIRSFSNYLEGLLYEGGGAVAPKRPSSRN